jgi:CelD/BcsL family acetyltransferase involved in cellulose biosynthesis
MHAAGRVRFAEISIAGNVVAARACMETHGGLYLYYSGFDPAWWKYSVMTLAVTEILKDAIARGLSTINFSPGVDDSKSRWGPQLIPTGSIVLVRKDPAARARYWLLSARKRIRQPLHRQLDRLMAIVRKPAVVQGVPLDPPIPWNRTAAHPQPVHPSAKSRGGP